MRTLAETPVKVDSPISVRADVELAASMFHYRPSGHVGWWDDPMARLYGANPAIAEQALDCRARSAAQASHARRRAAVRHFVSIGPGVVRLRSGKPREWERAESETWDVEEHRARRQAIISGLVHRVEMQFTATAGRSRIRCWSKKSRREMLRSIASYDWSPIFDSKHPRALITLTYGSDWVSMAPDAVTSKKHLQAFREAYKRDVGTPWGSWKLEFQMRGAPHYHLLMLAPKWIRVAGVRAAFVDWVAETWVRIVKPDDTVVHFDQWPVNGGDGRTERERMLIVQRGEKVVDWAFGSKCTTPMALAAYMMKHNAPGGFSKEYQHDVPAEWIDDREPELGCEGPTLYGAGPGRFWGIWELERCVEEVEISGDRAVEVQRLLTRVMNARCRPGRVVRRRRVDRRTGVIRYRNVFVPANAHNLRWVLAGSGPDLARSIARCLVDPVEWPAGQRRPLP